MARFSARASRPIPSSRWITWMTQWAEPGSSSRWVRPTMGTIRPQRAAAATRLPGTPARWARAAMVHSPSTSRMPRSWGRGTTPRAVPAPKRMPRTSWTPPTTRMAIWMAVMVRMLLLPLGGWSGEPAGADQAGLVGEHDQLGPVAGAELAHGPADVGLGRCRADDQLGGDLVVGQAGRDQAHDLALAVGELAPLGWGGGASRPRWQSAP